MLNNSPADSKGDDAFLECLDSLAGWSERIRASFRDKIAAVHNSNPNPKTKETAKV